MPKMENAPVRSEVRAPTSGGAARKDVVVYEEIREHYKAEGGANARALRAMFTTKADYDRHMAVVMKMLAQENDVLLNCTPQSIWDAIDTASAMGLVPMTTDGALIRRGQKATFMPMYGGYLKRIRNSNTVQDVDTQLACENDDFTYRLGTDPTINHTPLLADRGNYTHVYAWALMASGKYIIEVMDVAEINNIRDTYGSKSNGHVVGPWVSNYGEMARKTVIRRLAKRLPQEATQQLLMADKQADEVITQMAVVKDDMADLRRLALSASTPTEDAPKPEVEPTHS